MSCRCCMVLYSTRVCLCLLQMLWYIVVAAVVVVTQGQDFVRYDGTTFVQDDQVVNVAPAPQPVVFAPASRPVVFAPAPAPQPMVFAPAPQPVVFAPATAPAAQPAFTFLPQGVPSQLPASCPHTGSLVSVVQCRGESLVSCTHRTPAVTLHSYSNFILAHTCHLSPGSCFVSG